LTNYFVEARPDQVVAEYPLGDEFRSQVVDLSLDALHALQSRRFLTVIERAWEIPFYDRRWRAAGLEPGAIQGLDDLTAIPTFSKSDLMQSVSEHPPFGDFHGMDDSEDGRRQVVFHTTSGTTGDPQPLFFGAWDREVQNALLARAYTAQGVNHTDVVHSVYGFGMVNGGHFVREALTHFTRALLLTPGTGVETPSEQQIRFMQRFGVTVLVGFADYLLRLAEVAQSLGIDPATDLNVRMLSGHIPADRADALAAAWGGARVFDWYGVGDTGVIAAQLDGSRELTVFEDAHLLEIVDPESHAAVADGQIGNQCVTVLFKNTVYPIVRFDTQDLTAISANKTGSLRRTKGFCGRSDNMVKLRGINVYPTAIGAILDRLPSANGEYVCLLTRVAGREELEVQVEWDHGDSAVAAAEVAEVLRSGLGVKVDVRLVATGQTAALTGVNVRQKPQRLVDHRDR
jgi:phenylacetate-CoA ligase